MHDLDQLIAKWRRNTAANVSAETLDELETHLRETTEQLVRSGVNISEAFHRAVAELGEMEKISSEFRKLDEPLWLPVKLVIGVTALLTLVSAIFAIARFDSSRSGLLLATHFFTILLGYTLTLLIGGLGICFVSQRCFEDFSSSRLHSIGRVSFVLSGVALPLTAIGIILGMAWAKIELGRYWAWDAKETGGLCVLVWLAFYLLAHQHFKGSARGILTISMLGNIVVSLAWLGPQLSGLQQYGVFSQSMLLMAVLANLVFCVIGYLPSGWLRSKRA